MEHCGTLLVCSVAHSGIFLNNIWAHPNNYTISCCDGTHLINVPRSDTFRCMTL